MSLTIAPSPSDMMLFAVVGREGSFTGAARALGLTKQSVSERVAKLERQLEVRLFERTTRSLRLTQPGAAYFERCSAIAAQIDQANAELRRGRAEPVGLVRVTSSRIFGRHFLTPLIARFLSAHPRASVELVLADRRVNLIEEGLDVAIVIGPLPDSTFVARRIGEAVTVVVASPDFLARHGRPTARTLGQTRCVGLAPIEEWTVKGLTSRVEPVFIANDLEIARDAALAGVGLARVPRFLCREALAKGRLRVLFGSRPALVRPIWAVYPSRVNVPLVSRLFLDALATLGAR